MAHNEFVCPIHWLARRQSLVTDKPWNGPSSSAAFTDTDSSGARGPPYLLEVGKLGKATSLHPTGAGSIHFSSDWEAKVV